MKRIAMIILILLLVLMTGTNCGKEKHETGFSGFETAFAQSESSVLHFTPSADEPEVPIRKPDRKEVLSAEDKKEEVLPAEDKKAEEKPKPAPHPVSTIAEEKKKNPDMCARLYIPDVGINVALVFPESKSMQETVDAKDSACVLDFTNCCYIADHNFQGFSALTKVVPNKTVALIDDGKQMHRLKCVGLIQGVNKGYELVFDGDKTVYDHYQHHLVLYTCKEAGPEIYIAVWKEI